MNQKSYYTYIMSNKHDTCLYTGVTNNLLRRAWQHKNGEGGAFTKKYKCHKLVYFEQTNDVNAAIAREKEIKGWSRKKKETLIDEMNPERKDLYEDLMDE